MSYDDFSSSKWCSTDIKYLEEEKVFEQLDRIRAERSEKFRMNLPNFYSIISGPRTGKTTVVEKYENLNKGYNQFTEIGTEVIVKPVIYVQLPFLFTYKSFYTAIISSLGIKNLSDLTSIHKLKCIAIKLLKDYNVEMLILDEMYKIKFSELLKIDELSKEAQVSIVCVATNEFEYSCKLVQQKFSLINNEDLQHKL